jgi:hypothetical protein
LLVNLSSTTKMNEKKLSQQQQPQAANSTLTVSAHHQKRQ